MQHENSGEKAYYQFQNRVKFKCNLSFIHELIKENV